MKNASYCTKLKKLSDLLVTTGAEFLWESANVKPYTSAKDGLLSLTRRNVSDPDIRFNFPQQCLDYHSHSIKNTKFIMNNQHWPYPPFWQPTSDFIQYYINTWPKDNNFCQDSTNYYPMTPKENLEHYATKITQYHVGNCNECADIIIAIALECSDKNMSRFGLTAFEVSPYIEEVTFEDKNVDHVFVILGRDPEHSSLSNIESWVKDGNTVYILDLWFNRKHSINVQEQLNLLRSGKRPSKAFKFIYNALHNRHSKLKHVFFSELGNGHSPRWKDAVKKGKKLNLLDQLPPKYFKKNRLKDHHRNVRAHSQGRYYGRRTGFFHQTHQQQSSASSYTYDSHHHQSGYNSTVSEQYRYAPY